MAVQKMNDLQSGVIKGQQLSKIGPPKLSGPYASLIRSTEEEIPVKNIAFSPSGV